MSARFDKNIEADSSPIGVKNLLAEARDGDVSAFRELYRIYFENVYFLFYFMSEDSDIAELFTKEVFVIAWISLTDFDSEPDFKSGLLHVIETVVFESTDGDRRLNSLSARFPRSEIGRIFSNDALLQEKAEQILVPARSLWPEIQMVIETLEMSKAESGTVRRKVGVIIGVVVGGLFCMLVAITLLVVSSGDEQVVTVDEPGLAEGDAGDDAQGYVSAENAELTQLQANYDVVKTELSKYRESTGTDEKPIVEEDLDLVESSITEIMSALGDDPGNEMLERMLIKTYNRHLGLMKDFLMGDDDE